MRAKGDCLEASQTADKAGKEARRKEAISKLGALLKNYVTGK